MSITPKDRDRLNQLEMLSAKVRHAHSLIEQFAASPKAAEQLSSNIRRTFAQLKIQFTTAGFDRLAQMTSGLEMTARRGMSHAPKTRALRDGLGTLSRQIDLERRAVMTAAHRDSEKQD